jgi:two-component system, OmpR family, response regulator PfeR
MAAMNQQRQLLVIEDDPQLREQLQQLLQSRDFLVHTADSGSSGMQRLCKQHTDLILLDIRLPDINGFELLARIREQFDIPVIILSACGAEADRITGLSHGADDYLAKPFSTQELRLRILAVLRRYELRQFQQRTGLSLGSLTLDKPRQQVRVSNTPLSTTPAEFSILWQLALQPSQVLNKRLLYPLVFGRNFTQHDRGLDMHISRLRKKLDKAGFDGKRIKTVHGVGYRLD